MESINLGSLNNLTMDFISFSKKFAKEIGGQYREYDDARSVIIVPMNDGRFQTVIGNIVVNEDYNRKVIQLISKVCEISKDIPFHKILKASIDFPYTKFIIQDDFLKVEATSFLINLSEDMIKEMIMEVALISDEWELKITGKDIY